MTHQVVNISVKSNKQEEIPSIEEVWKQFRKNRAQRLTFGKSHFIEPSGFKLGKKRVVTRKLLPEIDFHDNKPEKEKIHFVIGHFREQEYVNFDPWFYKDPCTEDIF